MSTGSSIRPWCGPSLLGLVVVAFLGCEPASDPLSSDGAPEPSQQRWPGEPGDAADRLFFQVHLEPVGDAPARGIVQLAVVGGHLTAKVRATGLEPLVRIPQHIHTEPTCEAGGAILVNLDENLAVAGEGPGVGEAYPRANPGGVVLYEASRSLADLRAAVNAHHSAGLETDQELLDWLDLENRNVHTHQPTPPFTPVSCGEVERIN